MDLQLAFNIALAIIAGLAGWFMKFLAGELKELKQNDEKLAKSLKEIEVLVAGKYVTRDELTRTMDTVFGKLDRIADMINRKVDK
jgi:hypothetical protein